MNDLYLKQRRRYEHEVRRYFVGCCRWCRQRRGGLVYGSLILVLAMAIPQAVLASIPEDNLIDQVMQSYSRAAGHWQPVIMSAAMWMFWTLAMIEITWTGITLRCQPWRAKRWLVVPGSREAALLTRRVHRTPEGKQSRHPNTASSHWKLTVQR